MVVPDLAEIMSSVAAMIRAADSAVAGAVRAAGSDLEALDARMARSIPDMDSMRMRIDELLRASAAHLRSAVSSSNLHVEGLKARLETLSPVGTLSRGYAIVQAGPDATVVSDASDLTPGDTALVTLARGAFKAKVVSLAEPK
jgi:exodeoxyribonuclease VII large subunit